jgi:hypothetical protein
VSAARVTIEVRLRDEWPGDDDFDLWCREVFRHRLAQIAAIETAEVINWERVLEPGEAMPA